MLSTAHHPHVIVIGSGLGGLTTAVIPVSYTHLTLPTILLV